MNIAPRSGAWIETLWDGFKDRCSEIAPRSGAWIETTALPMLRLFIESPLARGRGLKHTGRGTASPLQVFPRC